MRTVRIVTIVRRQRATPEPPLLPLGPFGPPIEKRRSLPPFPLQVRVAFPPDIVL